MFPCGKLHGNKTGTNGNISAVLEQIFISQIFSKNFFNGKINFLVAPTEFFAVSVLPPLAKREHFAKLFPERSI